ncbi:MAG: hypothetical protein QW279_15705, partial [Candidatus Jordarchaeaceae archaeon]
MSDKNVDFREEVMFLAVAHCILNRSTRWWQKGKLIENNKGSVTQILQFLSNNKIGVFQLPCPEFTFLGNPRPSMTKDDYESLSGFKEHCKKLALESAMNIKILIEMGSKPKITVFAIIGVGRSPSCAITSSPRKINGKIEYVKEKGLFFEFLEKETKMLGINVPFIELDMQNPKETCQEL